MRIVMVGNGIVANMAALYFRRRFPESVEVVVVGPDDRSGLPLVGESTIEITGNFLETQLGLREYLHQNHLPKYALTYYFKLDPNDINDRTYSIHASQSLPEPVPPLEGEGPMPISWQLNRTTFDQHLTKLVAEHDGIRTIDGIVTNVELDGQGGHQLQIEGADGEMQTLTADWLIDATGRKRLLARKMGLTVRPEGQRDCFWFRLADFDRSILTQLTPLGPKIPPPGEPGYYDRYYSTHHFMGPGNWIWLIPIKAEDDSELMSVGLVSHPDYFKGEVKSFEQFVDYVSGVHPVVSEFVQSGRVVDTNVLRHYHYVTSKIYSADRWAIVGDAAFAPDPLFSNGLAFCVMQLEQLREIISQDLQGNLTEKLVDDMAKAFMIPVISSQTTISNWYSTMHDPLLSSMKINWIETVYFFMFLPLVANRCHYDPARTSLWKALEIRQQQRAFDLPQSLADLRGKVGKPTPEHFVYKGKEKVNPRALQQMDDINDIYSQLDAGHAVLTGYVNAINARLSNGH